MWWMGFGGRVRGWKCRLWRPSRNKCQRWASFGLLLNASSVLMIPVSGHDGEPSLTAFEMRPFQQKKIILLNILIFTVLKEINPNFNFFILSF